MDSQPFPDVLVLRDRLRMLRHDLADAARLVMQIDGSLASRRGRGLDDAIAMLQSALQDLASVTANATSPDAWAQLHALSLRAQSLLEESLALLAGAALRRGGPRLYAIADALVDELVARTDRSTWASFTIPTTGDEYCLPTGAIGLRFPGSVWDLPIVAHEVGHLIAGGLRVPGQRTDHHPLENLAATSSVQEWAHTQELLADIIAAYLAGPAYAWACIVRGLDPLLAATATATHPPAGQRVDAVLGGLGLLTWPDLEETTDAVRSLWHGCVEAAGIPFGISVQHDPPGVGIAGLVAIVADLLPTSGYDGWPEAGRLASSVRGRDVLAPTGPHTRLGDLFTAAWTAKLARPHQEGALTEALTMRCEAVLADRSS